MSRYRASINGLETDRCPECDEVYGAPGPLRSHRVLRHGLAPVRRHGKTYHAPDG